MKLTQLKGKSEDLEKLPPSEGIANGQVANELIVKRESRQPSHFEYEVSNAVTKRTRRRIRIPRPPLFLISFILLVVVPSAASQFYLAFVASDQFVATARFAVRSAAEESSDNSNSLTMMGQSGGLSQVSIAGQDSHIVVAYIRSRSIIDDVAKSLDVRQIFSRPEADFWARLKRNASAEETTEYWKNMVTTAVDGPSGIVTVDVRAFRRKDALDLSKSVIQACEAFINEVSQRSKRDSLQRAESEMRRADEKVRQSLADMREFRDRNGMIDPVATATMTSKLIGEAIGEKIKIENELFVGQKVMSPGAPSLTALQARLNIVNEQIEKLKTTLTGGQNSETTLSHSLINFEELELKRVFAEKLYTLSQDALERARLNAEKQSIYIDVFVPPFMPDEATYPERVSLSIVIPIALVIIWGIFALLISAIEDHRT